MTRTLDPREPVPADIYATEPGAVDPLAVLLSARAVSAALSMELPKREAADWSAVK